MAKAKALQAQGFSQTAIAQQMKITRASVQTALRTPEAPTKAKPVAPSKAAQAWASDDAGDEEVTTDLVQQWLGEQIRDQRSIARHAKKNGEVERFQGASRALTALSLLFARIAKRTDDDHEGMYVSNDDLEAAAVRAREKLLERVRNAAEEAEKKRKGPSR